MGLVVRGKKVPDRWASCNTDTFQRIVLEWEPEKPIESRDRVKLYSILCDQKYEALVNSNDEDLDVLLWEASRFVYEENLDLSKIPCPKEVHLFDRTVPIPQDLGKLTIGQSIHIRQALRSGADPNGLISLTVAVYLQPLIDSKEFNFERAKEIEEKIKLMPIVVTYPIGFFFLSKLVNFGSGFWQNLLLRIRRKVRSVQQSLNWRKASDWMMTLKPLFSTVLLRLTPLILTMCTKRNLIPSSYF
jgi:hypothetical protein